MGQGILADSNCVIEYLENKLPVKSVNSLEDNKIELSVINRIELLAWRLGTPAQIKSLQEFIYSCTVHSLSEEIILKTIEVRKKFRLKLPDAIIAATALIHNLTLYSRNLTDFKKIPDLDVVNPHSL